MPDTERLVLGPGPATRKLLRAESALQQRVEFESLVYRLQNHFVNLPTSDLDWGIEEAMAAMAEYIGVEQGHCFRVFNHGQSVSHSHQWTSNGHPTGLPRIKNALLDSVFPWAAQRLRRGDGLAIYSVAALSDVAVVERGVLQEEGILSLLLVPMIIRGELVGFLGLASTTREIQWDTDAVSLLKLAGGNVADVFDRQNAENAQAQLVSILEATSDLVAIADKDSGELVYLNQAGRRMIGLGSEEKIGHLRIADIVPPWAADIKNHVCFPTVDAIGSWTGESAVLTRDGREITVSESITLLPGRSRGSQAYAFIIRDITEQKRLEKEVLDIAEREQSRFGHDLHDGLGQHLTGVQFMAQVLQQKLSGQRRSEAGEAGEIAKLIRNAITQTRDLARGLSPVVLQSKSLQDALRDLAAGITRRGQAECVAEVDDDIALTNSEAAIQLYRIAQEAVNNALKHGEATHIVVSMQHDEAGRIELIVRDNGRGFPDDFKPGLGMGLRVMNYRASLIGGSLEIILRGGFTSVVCSVEEEQLDRQNAAATPAPVIRRA